MLCGYLFVGIVAVGISNQHVAVGSAIDYSDAHADGVGKRVHHGLIVTGGFCPVVHRVPRDIRVGVGGEYRQVGAEPIGVAVANAVSHSYRVSCLVNFFAEQSWAASMRAVLTVRAGTPAFART